MSIKVIAFDMGGTLMEYIDMPTCWLDFYENALYSAVKELSLPLSDGQIRKTLEILRSYNPRVNYREEDFPPEYIFGEACAGWDIPFDMDALIDGFFKAFELKSLVYPESGEILGLLKENGFGLAVLTDVAALMHDELHKSHLRELLPYFDLYVSSISCGFRKPNPKGLCDIAEHFGVTANDMIYIGDEQKDIECARRFGCGSVLIDRKKSGKDLGQNHTITDLYGLKNILNF